MAFYLFPGVMYERFKRTYQQRAGAYYTNVPLSLKPAYQAYKSSAKQYLGFGLILQYIPGTNANKARQQLANELKPAIDEMRKRIVERPASLFKKYSYLFSLYSYLNIGPFFKFMDDAATGFDKPGLTENQKTSLLKLILKLPVLIDIFQADNSKEIQLHEDALMNVIRTIINPVRLLDNALDFIHQVANRLVDIGSDRYKYSSLPRFFLKIIPAVILGLVKIPVKALKHAVNFLLEVVKVLTIDPLIHIGSSIKYSYQKNKKKNRNEDELTATVKQLRAVKELRRAAKGRNDTSYTAITEAIDYATTYIGISKEDLYGNQTIDLERLVTIRGSQAKIQKTMRLLSLVNIFAANGKNAKDEQAAVDIAERVVFPRFHTS
ncbi:MAG: hypothetical protein Q8M03_04475 [Legionella sp.]|nr:hypothetical protein [Legionella sp.]